MPILKTVYQTATGKPVYEGFASDPSEQDPGNSVMMTEIPDFKPGQVLPWTGVRRAWILNGERIKRDDYPQAQVTTAGLGVNLSVGHIFGEAYGAASTPDSYTFASPAEDIGLAVDVVLDESAEPFLQPYEWDPITEEKGDLPEGRTLLIADVIRGILPAGATSLDELEEE